MSKIIGFTYDNKKEWVVNDGDPVDINAEWDPPETIDFIIQGIEKSGYKVKRIGGVHQLLKSIDDLGCDIVFNICEGRTTGRNRESQVPNILEMYNIPYIGADAMTLGLTLDKVMAKKCFSADGIKTPGYYQANCVEDLDNINDINFPLIVKCRYEGTSKGMTENSRVENMDQLKTQVERMTREYNQSVIIEEFIPGTEFTVAVIGNDQLFISPVIQIKINGITDLGNIFYTSEMVHLDHAVEYICPAEISDELEKALQDMAVKTFRSVDCRDVGRIDFRVDDKGQPYCIEINPLPCFAKEDVFNVFPKVINKTFADTMKNIIEAGLKRNGLLEEVILEH